MERISWREVFDTGVIEFLNVISYAKDKAEDEKRRMEEWKRKN